MKKGKINTRKIVESALLLAIGYLLSFIKIKTNAGSITIGSMLPIILLSYKYGAKWGSLVGFTHAMLQIVEGGIHTPPTNNFFNFLLVFVLDYALAWTAVGFLSGIVSSYLKKQNKKPQQIIVMASIVGLLGRLLINTLSGIIIWRDLTSKLTESIIFSVTSNALVIIPEIIITSIIGIILFSVPAFSKEFSK